MESINKRCKKLKTYSEGSLSSGHLRSFWRITDLLIIIIIAAFSLFMYFMSQKNTETLRYHFEIYHDNRLIDTIYPEIGAGKEYSYPENPSVIFELTPEAHMRFKSSNCRDQICVNSSEITQAGQFSACVPNGFLLRAVPDNEMSGTKEFDIVN